MARLTISQGHRPLLGDLAVMIGNGSAMGIMGRMIEHLVHAFHIPYEAWQNAEYVRKELASAAQEQCDSFTAQLDVSPECREKMTMELVEGSPLVLTAVEVRPEGLTTASFPCGEGFRRVPHDVPLVGPHHLKSYDISSQSGCAACSTE